jgi:hypothetical protein
MAAALKYWPTIRQQSATGCKSGHLLDTATPVQALNCATTGKAAKQIGGQNSNGRRRMGTRRERGRLGLEGQLTIAPLLYEVERMRARVDETLPSGRGGQLLPQSETIIGNHNRKGVGGGMGTVPMNLASRRSMMRDQT